MEKYLDRCLKSLADQSYPYIQIILIDDGSTDSSGSICDSWARRSANISVYHKANSGLSGTRNFGLSLAEGKYILFVDSDDYLSLDAVSELMAEALKSDAELVTGRALVLKSSENMKKLEDIIPANFDYGKVYTGKDYMETCLSKGGLRVEIWRNLYLRDFLLRNDFKFREGLYHEDEEFTPRVLLAAKRVVLSKSAFYYYDNSRSESIMNSESKAARRAHDMLLILDELSRIYENLSPRRLRRLLKDDICWKYLDLVCRQDMLREPGFLPERKRTLLQAYTLRRRIKALLFAVSPALFCRVMKKYNGGNKNAS